MSADIDREGPKAVYQQIADRIAADIRSGKLPPGRRIPTESAIEQTYGVARTTARHAVAELRARGLVYTVPARGSFVGRPESAG